MSSISSITGSSLLNSIVSGAQTGSATASNDATSITDSADLSRLVNTAGDEALIEAGLLGADTSLSDILGGSQAADDSNSLYNLLLSDANTQILQSNPAILEKLLAAEENETTDAFSSFLEKYTQTASSTAQTTTGTLFSEIV